MVFKWINHSSFLKQEQLMAVLYEVGIASHHQLCILTGWSEGMVNKSIKQIRERGKSTEESELWIRAFPIPTGKPGVPKKAYGLGRAGVKHVQGMMEMEGKVKESPSSQIHHSLGINAILVRFIERGGDLDNVDWLSTSEAAIRLVDIWKQYGPKDEKIKYKLIRPDALLSVAPEKQFWIEFDNDTEGKIKLEEKFRRYINSLTPLLDDKIKNQWINCPVIWVTPHEKRRALLERNWKRLVERVYSNWKDLPKMHFFVEGQETDFFKMAEYQETNTAPKITRKRV